ncbi:hypothetical protein GCM10027342_09470 [Photobacterium alginatilyticum]
MVAMEIKLNLRNQFNTENRKRFHFRVKSSTNGCSCVKARNNESR